MIGEHPPDRWRLILELRDARPQVGSRHVASGADLLGDVIVYASDIHPPLGLSGLGEVAMLLHVGARASAGQGADGRLRCGRAQQK